MKKTMRIIWAGLGFLFTGLGAVGTVLPILPTVPFLLAAVFCFAKSSEKLHRWFTGTRLYRNNLESFVKKRAMSLRTKCKIIGMVTLLMAVGFAMMSAVPVGRVVLAVVWICHVIYFGFMVETERQEQTDTAGEE